MGAVPRLGRASVLGDPARRRPSASASSVSVLSAHRVNLALHSQTEKPLLPTIPLADYCFNWSKVGSQCVVSFSYTQSDSVFHMYVYVYIYIKLCVLF